MPTDGHNAVINNKVPDLSRGDGEGCSGTDPYISAADRFTPAFPRFTFGSAARLISEKTNPKILMTIGGGGVVDLKLQLLKANSHINQQRSNNVYYLSSYKNAQEFLQG